MIGAVFVVLLVVGSLACARVETRMTRRMVDEYIEKFPGRCMICSMHRFGFQHGFERLPHPPPHDCIERKEEP